LPVNDVMAQVTQEVCAAPAPNNSFNPQRPPFDYRPRLGVWKKGSRALCAALTGTGLRSCRLRNSKAAAFVASGAWPPHCVRSANPLAMLFQPKICRTPQTATGTRWMRPLAGSARTLQRRGVGPRGSGCRHVGSGLVLHLAVAALNVRCHLRKVAETERRAAESGHIGHPARPDPKRGRLAPSARPDALLCSGATESQLFAPAQLILTRAD